MGFPLISIIIPTYNSGEHIKKALESVLNQTYKDIEILIVDGKSKDNTLEIVQAFQQPNIYVLSEEDSGIYNAINKGIKLAKGTWIYILGSDDFLLSQNVLDTVRPFLSDNSTDLLYGNVLSGGVEYAGEFSSSKLLIQNICQQAIFYRRSLFDRLGFFNEKFTLYADYVFNIRAFANEKVSKKYVATLIAFYSREGASSKRVDLQLCFDYLEVMGPLMTTSEQVEIVLKRWPYASIDLFRNGYKWKGFKLALQITRQTRSFSPLLLFLRSLIS